MADDERRDLRAIQTGDPVPEDATPFRFIKISRGVADPQGVAKTLTILSNPDYALVVCRGKLDGVERTFIAVVNPDDGRTYPIAILLEPADMPKVVDGSGRPLLNTETGKPLEEVKKLFTGQYL